MTDSSEDEITAEKLEYIGITAAVMSTLAFYPQAYKVYSTDRTADLSLVTYTTYTWGLILWIVYALPNMNRPTLISAIGSLIPVLYITYRIHQNNRLVKESARIVRK